MTDTPVIPAAWHVDACVPWARDRRVGAERAVLVTLATPATKPLRLVEQAA
jgi:hypothetical protein